MIWRGFKQVAVKSLIVDAADIRRRMKLPHVIELAADIRATGGEPIHPISIRAPKTLVCGRDRYAAVLLNGLKKIWVHVAECTDLEAQQLERRENIYRRQDNRAALIAEMVRLTEQQLRADAGLTQRAGGTGVPAPQTIKAEARRQVARQAGIKPEAVRKAEYRAAKETEAHDGGDPAGAADAPVSADARGEAAPAGEASNEVEKQEQDAPLDLLGAPRSCVDGFITPIQARLDAADQLLRRAQAELKALENEPHFPRGLYQQLHGEVHRLASNVRAARPAVICPWCKWDGGLVKACSGCDGVGWVSSEKAERAPAVLRDPATPMVAVNGRLWPLDAYPATGAKNGAAPPKAKRMRIEDEAGNELTLVRDEPATEIRDEDIPF